jgi:hypothetical protein
VIPDAYLDFRAGLTFEVVFQNSAGREIAGLLFIDGAWKISTEPLATYSSKTEALDAWENRFDHETGIPLSCPREIGHEAKKNGFTMRNG